MMVDGRASNIKHFFERECRVESVGTWGKNTHPRAFGMMNARRVT